MKVSIIGQGYVGLTLAVASAKAGHEVVGIDLNTNLVMDLAKGETYVPGVTREILINLIDSKRYTPTNEHSYIKKSEIVIIAVPTPLDTRHEPDLKYLQAAAEIISKNVSNKTLIVNESTSYPGTLRNVIKPIIDKNTTVELFYASAPERVDPGNKKWEIANTPRVIAGLTDVATKKAISFYSSFCQQIYQASSAEVAEASKLFENTFRQVNIALANEFSIIANTLGFSASEAIEAASSKPFGFTPFYPGIGVGGHCIPVDPTYLSYIANQRGTKAEIINLANSRNLNAHKWVAKRIQEFMEGTLDRKTIQIAGVSYKPNVSDLRVAPSILLINELQRLGAKVIWHDPLVEKIGETVSQPLLTNIDLGLIVTPHDVIDFSEWKKSRVKVLDLSSNSNHYGWPKFL